MTNTYVSIFPNVLSDSTIKAETIFLNSLERDSELESVLQSFLNW